MTVPTDRELARVEVTPAAIRVALAVRALRAEGERVTVERIVAATGHGKTQVYEARKELRRLWPDEFGAPESGEPDPPVTRKPAGQIAVPPRLDRAALLLPGTDIAPVPNNVLAPWRNALAEVVVPMEGQRSWDTYTVYSQAWDLIPDLVPADDDVAADHAAMVGNQIALTVDYVRRMVDGLGVEVDSSLIAMLVRQFGKAALYGLSQALGVTSELTTRDLYRYARRVAAGVVAELEDRP